MPAAVLALSDVGQAAALAGGATVMASGITALAARSTRSKALVELGTRMQEVESDLAGLGRRVELMTEAFGRWRTQSDQTLASELGAMRSTIAMLANTIARRDK